VLFIGTSETKDMPHSDETRLDGPFFDELSMGCMKRHDDEIERKLNFCTSCPINHVWQLPDALCFCVRILNSSGANMEVVGRRMYLFWLYVLGRQYRFLLWQKTHTHTHNHTHNHHVSYASQICRTSATVGTRWHIALIVEVRGV